MLRTLAVAALAVTLAAPVTLASAAEADVALIQKFAGTWTGGGKLQGGEGGNLDCRLTMRPNGDKLFFQGRCGIDGQGSQSFQGAIAYNESAGRYEARQGSDVVVGKRSGNGLVFTFSGRSSMGKMSSTMQLSGNTIRFDFKGVDARNDEPMSGRVNFKKS